MYVLLHIHHPPSAAAGAQGGKCFVPLLFPGDADGEAGLLPAAEALPVLPLEILKGLGLHTIYSYVGKGLFAFLDSVHHASAMAVWTTALICSLLFLGSEKGLIP